MIQGFQCKTFVCDMALRGDFNVGSTVLFQFISPLFSCSFPLQSIVLYNVTNTFFLNKILYSVFCIVVNNTHNAKYHL